MSCIKGSNFLLITIALLFLSGCQSNPKVLSEDEKGSDLQELVEQNGALKATSFKESLNKARKAWLAGKTELAQTFYVAAYNLKPKDVALLQEMADVYNKLGNSELEQVCYRLILAEQPDNLQVLERYGLLLIKQKEMSEAGQVLQKVVAKKQSWQAYNGLGIIADMKGKHKQALLYFDKAGTIAPENPEILNNIGYSLYLEGQLKKAQGYFLWAIKLDNGFKKAIYNYALTLARQRHYDEALSVFARVMEVEEANNNTGYLAMKNGDYDKAELYLRQALKLSPHYFQRAHLNLQELQNLRSSPESNE